MPVIENLPAPPAERLNRRLGWRFNLYTFELWLWRIVVPAAFVLAVVK